MGWFRRDRNAVQIQILLSAASPATSGMKNKPVKDEGRATVLIPVDIMVVVWRQLFPAERMFLLGGRRRGRRVRITSAIDVTGENPSAVHVSACPQKLTQALVDLDRTGAHLAMWVHSHPGEGPRATHPSQIDLEQDRRFREHYSNSLLGLIAVRDGWIRVWGGNQTAVSVKWLGTGIETGDQNNVFRLASGT